ncbi:hypothetical protein QUB60_29540 [Microcoleus sp. A2-C5]
MSVCWICEVLGLFRFLGGGGVKRAIALQSRWFWDGWIWRKGRSAVKLTFTSTLRDNFFRSPPHPKTV